MVKGKWFPQRADIAIPLALRQMVLGQGRDEVDDEAQQVVVYHQDEPVGTGRLWWAEDAFHLGGIGVVEKHRHKGYGDLLVRMLLLKAITHSAQRLSLQAPVEVAPFFARYGFVAQGEQAPGQGMVSMCLLGEDVQLGHCQGCDE